MTTTWQISKNGVPTRDFDHLIPRKGSVMADTATMSRGAELRAVHAISDGPAGDSITKQVYRKALALKEAVYGSASKARAWIIAQTKKGLSGDVIDFIRRGAARLGKPLSWLKTVVDTAGRATTVMALAGIPVVRKVVSEIVTRTYTTVKWVGEKIHSALDWTLRLFGKPGNWLANKLERAITKVTTSVRKVVSYVVDKFELYTNPETSKAARYVTQGAQVLAGHRLISAFIGGPVGLVASSAWALFTSKDLRDMVNTPIQAARTVLSEKNIVKQATDATKEAAEAAGDALITKLESGLGITPRKTVIEGEVVTDTVIEGEVVTDTVTEVVTTEGPELAVASEEEALAAVGIVFEAPQGRHERRAAERARRGDAAKAAERARDKAAAAVAERARAAAQAKRDANK